MAFDLFRYARHGDAAFCVPDHVGGSPDDLRVDIGPHSIRCCEFDHGQPLQNADMSGGDSDCRCRTQCVQEIGRKRAKILVKYDDALGRRAKAIAPSCHRLTLASDSSRRESASSKALASAAASRRREPWGLARLRRRLVLGPARVQECPLGKLVDKRTFRIMYLARIASRSLTFDCFGLGFRATCFDGDLHGTFHRIFEGHLDSEQSVLVGRFGFVRFHRPT